MTEPIARMRRAKAADYLQGVHGIPFTEATLASRNAAGLDPRPEYLGTTPYYRQEVLDEFAATAFTPESPVTATRRRAREFYATHRCYEGAE
jgi:hypothetical protein